jgi:peptidoglycan/LPS O-acetylase OafA/YrhL
MANKFSYIKSLDGMRGLFALFVVIAHWPLDLPFAPIGWESMQLFFILSGYLITSVLLNEKDKTLALENPRFGGYMKAFMLKRVFRIFPIYFGYLFIMFLVRYGLSDIKFFYNQTVELDTNGIWLMTYLYNLKDIFNHILGWQMAESLFFTHLWSLAMEEQFYVIFPFIIYFTRGKALKIIVLSMIIIPFFTRVFGYPYLNSIAEANNYGEHWAILNVYRNLFFQMDSLAFGAAAAIFNVHQIKNPRLWFYMLLVPLLGAYLYNGYLIMQIADPSVSTLANIFSNGDHLSVLGWLSLMAHPESLNQNYQYAYMFTLVNSVVFLMIVCAIVGKPILKVVFENKAVVYIGKISYSTYVFHLALIQVFFFVIKKFAFVPPPGHLYWLQILYFIVYLAILYFVSHLSYKYYEMYFLRLKSKVK